LDTKIGLVLAGWFGRLGSWILMQISTFATRLFSWGFLNYWFCLRLRSRNHPVHITWLCCLGWVNEL